MWVGVSQAAPLAGATRPAAGDRAQIAEIDRVARGQTFANVARMRWMALAALCAACATDPFTDHEEDSDFQVDPDDGKGDGVPATFDMNNVVDDALLIDADAMTVADVQAFFEQTPYGTRSWLASYQVDGVSAAQLIVDAAQARGINPVILLARMQAETSIVSKTAMPSQRSIDRALGCGCSDGASCSYYRGLHSQLDCGAYTLRRWYEASIDGSGDWRKGHTKNTLDPKRVTPANHSTASFYAYTPWVLYGTGGTWLVWNVTRKYVRYTQSSY
jgi:hypothetical protein